MSQTPLLNANAQEDVERLISEVRTKLVEIAVGLEDVSITASISTTKNSHDQVAVWLISFRAGWTSLDKKLIKTPRESYYFLVPESRQDVLHFENDLATQILTVFTERFAKAATKQRKRQALVERKTATINK